MIDKTSDNSQWVWRGPESKEGIDFEKRRLDGQGKSNDVDRKISLFQTFRYNLLSLARQILLRIEAARREFEPRYRQASQPRHRQKSQPIKPKELSPFLSGFFRLCLLFY